MRLGQYRPAKFGNALEYTFTVHEYLKGSGASQVTGIVVDYWNHYPTRAEAEAADTNLLAERDTQWESREAIVFLAVPTATMTQQADRYFFGAIREPDGLRDGYTVASEFSKRWLPRATATEGGSSTEQTYLMDLPGRRTAPTITLTEMKAAVAKIVAEVAAGDGTDAYEQCVYEKYKSLREKSAQLAWYAVSDQQVETPRFAIGSGLASATRVNPRRINYVSETSGALEGDDSHLFVVNPVGVVRTARPLPAGEYGFVYLERFSELDPCDAPIPDSAKRFNNYAVDVTAPTGVLHEAFFDPVTVGTAVKADGANGVLKPASFTDANGASATIESISYEPPSAGSGEAGIVKLEVAPHTGLANHVMDIIEMDGSVSLPLRAADATVDSANDTLSWSVSAQPWHDGDLLMVRIREGLP